MALYSRRSTLRDTLRRKSVKRSVVIPRADRLKGRYLFRAAVRLVFEYMDWIGGEAKTEQVTDDITINIQLTHQKKLEKQVLTLEDRAILLTRPAERTSDDKTHIYELFQKFRSFKKYPDDLRQLLASAAIYRYFPEGRVIVRQGHPAHNLYFIANGEVALSKVVTDDVSGDSKEIAVGKMTGGDTFGEIALLHMIPRTGTVVTETPVDLFLIPRDSFDYILRFPLLEEWDVLQDALVHFNYFKFWSSDTIRECCILSRLKDFQPNEILLGDGKGMINYVHFLLEGECRLIEHVLINEHRIGKKIQYELFDPKKEKRFSPVEIPLPDIDQQSEESLEMRSTRGTATSTKSKERSMPFQSVSKGGRDSDIERMSTNTATLLDVVHQWHEITEVAEMLMREPSVTSEVRYPDRIRTVFMQICLFYRGACFGLGEQMQNRRIVAITPTKCLLVPRYWLLERNRANIWERVKLFLNSKYPTRQRLFREYVRNQRWKEYKKQLVNDINRKGRCVHTNVTIHDVPYSTRISQ